MAVTQKLSRDLRLLPVERPDAMWAVFKMTPFVVIPMV